MIVSLLFGIAIIALWYWHDSAVGQRINRLVVAPVAGRLNRLERRHILFAILMIGVLLFAGEALAIFGPLDAGLVILWDVSTYVDIVMVSTLAAASPLAARGWRAVRGVVRRMIAPARQSPRHRAARTRRPTAVKPANDDEGRPRLQVA